MPGGTNNGGPTSHAAGMKEKLLADFLDGMLADAVRLIAEESMDPLNRAVLWEATAKLQTGADLYEALELADATLRGANMNRSVVERKITAALAKARGDVR